MRSCRPESGRLKNDGDRGNIIMTEKDLESNILGDMDTMDNDDEYQIC